MGRVGSYWDFWLKANTIWSLAQTPAGFPPANFGARLIAIPEPATGALLLVAAAAGGVLALKRRRHSSR
jgi:hypothetical protein